MPRIAMLVAARPAHEAAARSAGYTESQTIGNEAGFAGSCRAGKIHGARFQTYGLTVHSRLVHYHLLGRRLCPCLYAHRVEPSGQHTDINLDIGAVSG